jgi:hypothetical protein
MPPQNPASPIRPSAGQLSSLQPKGSVPSEKIEANKEK